MSLKRTLHHRWQLRWWVWSCKSCVIRGDMNHAFVSMHESCHGFSMLQLWLVGLESHWSSWGWEKSNYENTRRALWDCYDSGANKFCRALNYPTPSPKETKMVMSAHVCPFGNAWYRSWKAKQMHFRPSKNRIIVPVPGMWYQCWEWTGFFATGTASGGRGISACFFSEADSRGMMKTRTSNGRIWVLRKIVIIGTIRIQ